MKLKVYLAAGLFVASSLGLWAADQPPKKEPTAEEKAAMDAMMKAASPGEPHKKLTVFVGTWDATVKTFMQPGAPPQESKGLATNTAIFGGRFIKQDFTG